MDGKSCTNHGVFRLVEGNHVSSLVHLNKGDVASTLTSNASLAGNTAGRVSDPRLGLCSDKLLVELVLEILDPAFVALRSNQKLCLRCP